MKRVLNSGEVATLFGLDIRDVSAFCRSRHVQPLGKVRIGRSWVTRWAAEDIVSIAPTPDGY